jgi:hypothetical protein
MPTDITLVCGQPACAHPSFMHSAPSAGPAIAGVLQPSQFTTGTGAPLGVPGVPGPLPAGTGIPAPLGLPGGLGHLPAGTGIPSSSQLLQFLNVRPLQDFAPPRPIQAFYPATNPGSGPAAPSTVAAARVSVNTARNTSMTRARSVNSNNPNASAMVPVRIVLFPLKVNKIHMHIHDIETSLVCSPHGQPRWSVH